jgi:UPF0755 protein
VDYTSPDSELETRSSRRAQLRDEAPGRSRRRRLTAWVSTLVVVCLIGGTVGALFVGGVFAGGGDDYPGPGTGEVQVTITQGEFGDTISQNLVDAGVTKSFDAMWKLLLKQNPEPVFVPGVYRLKHEMSAQGALDALLNPANRVELTVTIPEGTTLKRTLAILSEKLSIAPNDLEAAAANPQQYGVPAQATNLEGFLFPATYQFNPGVTATEVITRMVSETLAALDKAGVPEEKRWNAIIIASIIQREAGSEADMYKVSRVFYNRLAQGMNLGSDVTTCYGANLTGKDCLLITQAQLDDASNLYNTRKNPGLPIGPICSPGATAIDAAYNPADGPWLYFVTVNLTTGETIFSETYAEHEAATAQYEKWIAEHPNAY